jgi:hypothetical protein
MFDDCPMLRALLKFLRATPPPGGRVLSVYLDTPPERLTGQTYRAAFDAGCHALWDTVDPAERQRFVTAADQVGRFLFEPFDPRGRGLAIFAAGAPTYFCAISLPAPPGDAVDWGERPRLTPLEWLVDAAWRASAAVILVGPADLSTIGPDEVETPELFVAGPPDAAADGAPG